MWSWPRPYLCYGREQEHLGAPGQGGSGSRAVRDGSLGGTEMGRRDRIQASLPVPLPVPAPAPAPAPAHHSIP